MSGIRNRIKRKRTFNDDDVSSQQKTNKTNPNDNNVVEADAQHPLNNILVLDIVLNHLGTRDLASARLVNKTWHSNFTLQRRWRDQRLYKLGNGDKGTVTTTLLKQQHPAINPADPMLLGHHPIRNVRVSSVLFDEPNVGFWELFGHGLKCLHLDKVRIREGTLLKNFLLEQTPSLEEFRYYKCVCDGLEKLKLNNGRGYIPSVIVHNNLKFMDLNTSNVPGSGRKNHYKPRFPISWNEFFSAFPKLQKLKVDIDPRTLNLKGEGHTVKLIEAIQNIRNANEADLDFLNITELHIAGNGLAGIRHLTHDDYLFTSWPISILHMDVTTMQMAKVELVLENLRLTLRHLTLVKADHSRHHNLRKDMLPLGLTKLCLLGPFFSSFEFLECTPNLEELHMEDITSLLRRKACVNLAVVPPLVNLKKLTFELNDSEHPENILILADLMPNLKNCSSTVETEGFRMMCEAWTALEHLDLKFCFESEDVFVEHLTKLKRLRSLKMDCDRVTDKSVFGAFVKMQFLTKLQLPASVWITDQGKLTLDGKISVEFFRS